MHHCSYCQKVKKFMADNKIVLPLKEINEPPENREELIKIGGKGQVPCLVIDGKALYESDAIIAWLKKHKTQL